MGVVSKTVTASMHNVLIAEDEDRIAAFISKGLQRYGFKTVVARDGIDAVEQVVDGEFDLMLLDLGLPGRNGWEVLAELKRLDRLPKIVIVVTARDDFKDRLNSSKFGVNDYIVKPFKFSDLLASVQTQLGKN